MACSTKRILFAICQINILALCFAQKYPGDICTTGDKRDGICRTIDQCETARKELSSGKMPVTCDFEGSSPFVCCPEEVEPLITQPSKEPGERANYWCGRYIEKCPRRKGIAGGVRALPSEFPHMAAIGVGDENNTQWLCGGTLISETFVMTAAHCLNSGNRGPARWVLLGTESTVRDNTTEGRKGQIHPVVRRIRHPDYKPPSKYHDVALLEIGPAITPDAISTVSRLLHPACLPTTNRNYTRFRAIATGWGRTGHAEDGSPELLKVELNIFEVSKCNETFDLEIRTTDWLKSGIDDTMLCAGVLEGGKDTCQGDSGGPLQFSIRNSCMYEVWGITSFGKSCAFANSPAIYTRVSDYVQWIEEIIWP